MNPLTESSCKNCSNVLPPTALFCPNCGQKNSNGKITVKEFIGEFFESVLNLDSRIIKTLGSIFIPARLTVEYFKGKHKKYVHPLRLFFIVAVGHFSILGIISNSQIGNIKTTMDGIDRQN